MALPSVVEAVITTEPLDRIVTRPVASTVAMELSVLVHESAGFVALFGKTVALSLYVATLFRFSAI